MSRVDQTLDQQTEDDRANRRDLTLKLHTVEVVRDPMTKIGTQVLDHEIPILEALHGADNVIIRSTEDVQVSDIDAGTEYDRLMRKYERSNEGGDIVQKVYGQTPRELAEEMGLPYKTARGVRQARQQAGSVFVDGANPAPEVPETKISRISSPVKSSSTVNPNSRGAREIAAKVKSEMGEGAKPAKAKTAAKAKPAAKGKGGKTGA